MVPAIERVLSWSRDIPFNKELCLPRPDIILIGSLLPKVLSALKSTLKGSSIIKLARQFLWGLYSSGYSYYSATQVVYMSP